MRKDITVRKYVCDCCEETLFDDNGLFAYEDGDIFEEIGREHGWITTADGKHYCPDCYDVVLSDEEDIEFRIKDEE